MAPLAAESQSRKAPGLTGTRIWML